MVEFKHDGYDGVQAHGDVVRPPEVLWLICRARSPRSRTRRDRRGSQYRAKPLSTSTDLPL